MEDLLLALQHQSEHIRKPGFTGNADEQKQRNPLYLSSYHPILHLLSTSTLPQPLLSLLHGSLSPSCPFFMYPCSFFPYHPHLFHLTPYYLPSLHPTSFPSSNHNQPTLDRSGDGPFPWTELWSCCVYLFTCTIYIEMIYDFCISHSIL